MPTRTLGSAAAAIVLAASVLAAQAPAPRPPAGGQPPSTFKVEVNYVEIDAVVTDAGGKFVQDLTRDDFQIAEAGVPQTISTFSRVDVPIERADPPLFKRAAVEPDVRSNRDAFSGRVFLLLLDDLQTDFRRTPQLRAAAHQFVRRYVGANDMVAVVTTGGDTRAGQEFTGSQARLIAAIDKFAGRKTTRDSPEMERSMRARNTYETLRNLSEFLGAVHGRRKAIVWFGEGVEYDIGNPFAARDADAVRQSMQAAIAAASRANVNVYAVDPRGLGAGLDENIEISGVPDDTNGPTAIYDNVRRGQDSLRTVAAETGGFAIINQNDLNAQFERIVQENSSYYMLGYHPTNEKRDGGFRNVQVRVTRPGLTLRARKGYVAPVGRPVSTAPKGQLAAQLPAEIRDAFASPIPTRDIPITLFAAPFSGVAPKASVALVVEVDASRLPFVEKEGTFNDDLELHVLAIDATGKVQSGARDVAPLRLRPATRDAILRNGLRFTRRLQLPPGRYQIHAAVRETNGGGLGTIRLDLDVPDFGNAPLQMSGIALTSASANRFVTINPDPEFKDVLPAPAAAVREFPRDDTLAVFTEIYDNQAGARHRVAIKTSVLSDDGRVVFTAGDERNTDELQGKKGGFGYTLNVPLSGFGPGRYVLRVEAQAQIANGGTAARELEFRIR
jgi:VWFA-related protein